jgi:SAM-dependent methyltransferase
MAVTTALGPVPSVTQPREPARALRIDAPTMRFLFTQLGPSLGLWRAAEVAVLREQAPLAARPILDVGCGDGLVTALAFRAVDIALDPDPVGLAKAARWGVYRERVACTAEGAGLPAGSMATVLSNSVMEHVEAIDEALASVARLLRPGGRLILTTPTEAFSRWLALPLPAYAARRNRHLIHPNLWSAAEWARRLVAVGLTVETVRPYMRHALVSAWDAVDMLERVWIGRRRSSRRRLVGMAWKRLSADTFDELARRAAQLDLSAPPPGGGQLIVARKTE